MADWAGHAADTRSELLEVITTATTGSRRPSRAARVLFTACEFWAAARNRTLLDHLKNDAVSSLQAASAAFTEIGLSEAPRIVDQALLILTTCDPPCSVPRVADSIERLFVQLDEPIDRMIAEFAHQQTCERQQKRKDDLRR